MAWQEVVSSRKKHSKTWYDADTNLYHTTSALDTLHYETVLDSGEFDAQVSMLPYHSTAGGGDFWRVINNNWHYALGRPPEKTTDGWTGFGGRQGEHWLLTRLTRVGYVHWPTRAWQDVGGAPNYDRANLSTAPRTMRIGPGDGEVIIPAAQAWWSNIWTTPAGSVDLEYAISGGRMRENIHIPAAVYNWVRLNKPPTTPVSETYFTLAFEIDWSDIPKAVVNQLQLSLDGDLSDIDNIELRNAADALLAFLPVEYVFVGQGGIIEEYDRLPLRRRIYFDGEKYWMLLGIRVDELMAVWSVGDELIFDPTVNETIVADSDDAWDGGSTLTTTASTIGNARNQGWRFQSVTVPQGATIDTNNTAFLTFVTKYDVKKVISVNFYGVDADTTSTWSASNLPSNATTTTASWPVVTSGTWAAGSKSVNAAGIVQEIVDRAGWSSGNDISLVCFDNGSDNNTNAWLYDYFDASGNLATLDFEYTGGTTQSLAAVIASTTTVAGNVAIEKPLLATSDTVSTVTAVLTNTRPLAATTDTISTITADLSKLIRISATSDSVTTVAANMIPVRGISASSDTVSTVEASLLATKPLSATTASATTITADLSVEKPLSASVDSVTTVVVDTVTISKRLEAVVSTVSTAAGTLEITRGIASNIDSTSTLTAVLSQTVQLIGISDTVSTVTATISPVRGLSAQTDTVSTVTATLESSVTLSSTIATVSTVSASVTPVRGLQAASATETTVQAALSQTVQLVGLSETISTVSVDMTPVRGIQATSDTVSSISAILTVGGIQNLYATIETVSTVTADAAISHTLSSTISSNTAVAATLTPVRGLAAVSVTVSVISADLTAGGIVSLAATSETVSTISANAVVDFSVAGIIAETSTVTTNLSKTTGLSATTDTVSEVTATLTVGGIQNLYAVVDSTTAFTASLELTIGLDTSSVTTSSLVTDLSVTKTFEAITSETSTIAGNVEIYRGLSSSIDSITIVDADLFVSPTVTLTTVIDSTSDFVSDLSVLKTFESVITSESTLSVSSLPVTVGLTALPESVTLVSGDLAVGHTLQATIASDVLVTADISLEKAAYLGQAAISDVSVYAATMSDVSVYTGVLTDVLAYTGVFTDALAHSETLDDTSIYQTIFSDEPGE